MSNKIIDLNLKMQTLCNQHIENCKKLGVIICVYFTSRTNEEQDALYAQGRLSFQEICAKRKIAGLPLISEIESKKIVTNAKPGSSFHNYGLAYDAVPYIKGTKVLDWNMKEMDSWKIMWNEAKKLGLTLGKDFKSIQDNPHFQYSGITIQELKSGKTI